MKKSTLLFCLMIASFAIFSKSTLSLNVKGMHCGGCEMKVKKIATEINGVTEVTSVSAADSKAVIVYDEKTITADKLVAELAAQTGYSVSTISENGAVSATGKPAGCCSKGQGAPACKEGEKAKCDKSKKKCDKKAE
jgi:copper chaperone CopZ